MRPVDYVSKAVWWCVIISVFGLAACTAQPVRLVPICVPQYAYSPTTMSALYNEVAAYGSDTPTMTIMLGNYSDMRRENAICVKAQAAYFQKWGTKAPSLAETYDSLK